MKGHPRRSAGFSIMEMLVTLSIVATLAALVFPTVGQMKRGLYVTRCLSQVQQISVAIRLYREDYRHLPWPLGRLAPDYISPDLLVCPWLKTMVGSEVIKQQNAAYHERYPGVWSSYWEFCQEGLDDLYQRGEIAISYSQILDLRKGDTPLVICRDHRERFADLWVHDVPIPEWDFPEQPIVVLRWDGRVDLSRKGGTRQHLTSVGTVGDALDL